MKLWSAALDKVTVTHVGDRGTAACPGLGGWCQARGGAGAKDLRQPRCLAAGKPGAASGRKTGGAGRLGRVWAARMTTCSILLVLSEPPPPCRASSEEPSGSADLALVTD